MTIEKIALSWSGGKDCILTLDALSRAGHYKVAALLTTLTEEYQRVSMHGLRRELVRKQAESLGVELQEMIIPCSATNNAYESSFKAAMARLQEQGIRKIAFGDLYLDDVRTYRLELLNDAGIEGLFPLWQNDTFELANAFISRGFRAVTVCVDSQALKRTFAGREFDRTLLRELPPNVDPCGENGEFHTFVYDGSLFAQRIAHHRGQVVLRDERFYYCDLLPAYADQPPGRPGRVR